MDLVGKQVTCVAAFLIASSLGEYCDEIINAGEEPYYCASFSDIPIFDIDECIYESDLCNSNADCPFGDDEWNCVDESECTVDNGYFECEDSPSNLYLDTDNDRPVCIPLEWSCYNGEYFWDCPNQEDVDPALCSTVDPDWSDTFDGCGEDGDTSFFQCTNTNDFCININFACDNFTDCLDGQDEQNCLPTTTAAPIVATNFTSDYSCATLENEIDCLRIPPFTSYNDIFAPDLGFDYTCYWNESLSECKRLSCNVITDEELCLSYNTMDFNFVCNWKNFNDTVVFDDDGICYNDCPANYEIVFTIDTSTSVIDPNQGGDESNRERQLSTTLELMKFVWLIAEEQRSNAPNIYNYTKFALITYNQLEYVTTHFDLNNDFTTLEEYIEATTEVFENMVYRDDTATSPALEESYNVWISETASENGDNWRRLQLLITDGRPNIPSTAASPCYLNGEFYNFNQLFYAESIYFYSVLVGFSDTSSFECLEEPQLLAKTLEVETFLTLQSEIRNVFQTQVCQLFPTTEPTNLPTEIPTDEPSENPTNEPTDNPTNIPTNNPTDNPTERPSNRPTVTPTNIPSIIPTNIPSNNPTDNPSDNPSNSPTNDPTDEPSIIPTKTPSVEPTESVPTPKPTTGLWWAPGEQPTSKPTYWWEGFFTPNPTTYPTNKPTDSPTRKRVWWADGRS